MNSPAQAPFGLYRSAAFNAATRLSAGNSLTLDRPQAIGGGAFVFRLSLWLPLPPACREARALQLADSRLELRFTPGEMTLATDDSHWFSSTEDTERTQARLSFVWPATVVRIDGPHAGTQYAFGLHRADGEAVSAEASQRGRTGQTLAPAWQGSPLVVRFDAPVPLQASATLKKPATARPRTLPQARALGVPAAGGLIQSHDHGLVAAQAGIIEQLRRSSQLVPSVRIAARPTSPRLRLVLEEGGSERLLWQTIAAGEHTTAVSLPTAELAQEWAAALEQIIATCSKLAPGAGLPGLRLDIESDAPCTVNVLHAALALDAEYDLLADGQAMAPGAPRLVFDGSRRTRLALELPAPPAGNRRSLQLGGRMRCADMPGVGPGRDATTAAARQGLLLEEDHRVEGRLALLAPSRVAGLVLGWHPLSARLRGSLRVLPADARRGTPALLAQAFDFDTDTAGVLMLAVRWPALDLQAQALRIELGLQEGRGIWLSGSAGEDWHIRQDAGDLDGRALALTLDAAWLDDDAGDGTTDGGAPAPSFHLGSQSLTATDMAQGRFALSVAPPALDAWPGQPLCVESGIAAEVVIESAVLKLHLG